MLNGSTDIMVDPLVTSDFIEGVMSKSRGDIMIDQAAASAVRTVCNSCSGEPTPANQVIPERPDSVIFKIHGMDCADEVTLLKREVGPVVGSQNLSFDLINGRMSVAGATGGVDHAGVLQAVERTGMRAELWREGENRSEEHTSELQSLMRISYAVFCLKKKNTTNI